MFGFFSLISSSSPSTSLWTRIESRYRSSIDYLSIDLIFFGGHHVERSVISWFFFLCNSLTQPHLAVRVEETATVLFFVVDFLGFFFWRSPHYRHLRSYVTVLVSLTFVFCYHFFFFLFFFLLLFNFLGTTWTQEMLWLMANDCDFEAAGKKTLTLRSPFLE